MDAQKQGADALFILLGAVMVLAMHAGFAFLELGTVRKKNQVNALVKILVDFCMSTLAYFVVGYGVAYGTSFMVGAQTLADKNAMNWSNSFSYSHLRQPSPPLFQAALPNAPSFGPNSSPQPSSLALSIPSLRALLGTNISAFKHGSRPSPATSSTTLPARSSSTLSAVGWLYQRLFCWAREATATARTAPSQRTLPRAFLS